MKIYTKTGDLGETALVSGRRILKSDLRIDAYGTVDELNSWLGVLADKIQSQEAMLREIQNRLFMIGSLLANDPEKPFDLGFDIEERDIVMLENWIDEMDKELAPLRNFILPGGHEQVSFCHVSRTVCRRAERLCVALNQVSALNPLLVTFLNRLSDALFTLARFQTLKLNIQELNWEKRK
jgi:cob(I)alamin adenosyltransferase